MTYDDDSFAGGDDRDKLVPEWGRSSDEQILWLGLAVVAILAGLFFFGSRCGDLADSAAGAAGLGGAATADLTIDEVLSDDGDLSRTDTLFERAEINSDLGNESAGPYTVFAPTNGAWDDLGDSMDVDDVDDVIDDFSDDDASSAAVTHIVEGEYTLSELLDEGTVTTIDGYELTFDDDELINGAVEIEDADIETANGIVHTIDGVLPVPVEVAEAEPTPEPEIEEAAAPAPTPEPTPEPTPVPDPTPEPTPVPDPVTIASLAGETADLSSITALVTQLGLDTTLADPDAGPFTVFAPNNAAVEAAGESLASFDEADVQSTVLYHVVAGEIPASEVVPGARFETLSGRTLAISGDNTLPGGINVITADLQTDNGIVHIIDGLLVPTDLQLRSLNELVALEPIQFDVSSAVIRPESATILNNAAAVLKNLPAGTIVEIGGHTDSDGDAASNQALSQARAESVRDYLVGQGVDAETLTETGYGETALLVDPELTDADKQANRRIEFTEAG